MRRFALLLLSSAMTIGAFAGGPITWTFSALQAADGQEMVQLQAVCEAGWHIYALTLPRDDGPFPTVIRVTESKDFEKGGDVAEPAPQEHEDPNFQMTVRYHEGKPVFTIPIKRHTQEAFTVSGEVEYMSCNDRTCLPPQVVKFNVIIPAAK